VTSTGGYLLVQALRARGIDTMFGLPGVQLDGLFDALAVSDMRVVHTRHEQAASYMADGYARATGRVGVCAVVPGPGVLNAGAGLATAYANHSPVLLIAGHLFGGDGARGTGALHEIVDQGDVIAGVVGETNRIRSVEEIETALDAAFAHLAGHPSRPAAIEIGPDVLLAETDLPIPVAAPAPPPPAIDASAVEQAAAALADRARPIIIAGGGARLAGEGLRALSAALCAPVVVTSEGKGSVPDDLPDTLPHPASFTLLDEADGVVVVGSRFSTMRGPVQVSPDTVVVRIDADPARLAASHGGDVVAIHGDAPDATSRLAEAVAAARVADEERDALHQARVAELRSAIFAGLAQEFPDTWTFCRVLRDVIPADGILVDEMTQVGYMARMGYPAAQGRNYIGSGYQGTLGFGYATALGAKVGCPERVVVSISGDGGFLYNVAELATAAHHRIAVVAVVFSDNAYGNVKGIQQRVYGREIASTLTNPDYVKLADSFGIHGAWATDADELGSALTEAIERDEPALIGVPIEAQPDILAVITGRRRL